VRIILIRESLAVAFFVKGSSMRIKSRGMTKGSLFKFLWISNLTGSFFLFVIFGVASLFGADTVRVNNQPVTGPMGLVAAMVMWPIFSAIVSCLGWVFVALGFWVYSRFTMLELEFIDAEVMGNEPPSCKPVPESRGDNFG
jgi:hypothetical protein